MTQTTFIESCGFEVSRIWEAYGTERYYAGLYKMAHRITDIKGGLSPSGLDDRDGRARAGQAEIIPESAESDDRQDLGVSPLAELEKALEGREFSLERHRFLLLLRFLLVNLVGFALLGAAYLQGWVGKALASDSTGMVVLIFGLFVVGLVLCGWKVWRASSELNQIKAFDPLRPSRVGGYLSAIRLRTAESRSITAELLKLKLSNRIGVVRQIANSLVLLGLIGTVVGFIIALSGVDVDLAADVNSVGPMISTLIGGMSVALYTTLVGAVLNIWLMVNYRLLLNGTVNLVTSVVELGERYARD
ncbi:MAG: MotA/TolQ/ExbB proton channel family protein [Alphaproteobacteria bacterium]|nr:MotA/TolQ/ExbB proton channel family protein [Alphaproteobacteria bacterium]MDP6590007.1 MotA/TolQ/ExbB proton channel family protein [Alphaproteobacteria bacterium]